jgi:hypothetical protein
MARFGLKIRLPTQANPFAQLFSGGDGGLVEPRSAKITVKYPDLLGC